MNLRRLKDLREDKDLMQKEVADKIGTTQQQYSRYENQLREMPANLIYKLAIFYNTSTDYIMGLTNIKEPYPRSKK